MQMTHWNAPSLTLVSSWGSLGSFSGTEGSVRSIMSGFSPSSSSESINGSRAVGGVVVGRDRGSLLGARVECADAVRCRLLGCSSGSSTMGSAVLSDARLVVGGMVSKSKEASKWSR